MGRQEAGKQHGPPGWPHSTTRAARDSEATPLREPRTREGFRSLTFFFRVRISSASRWKGRGHQGTPRRASEAPSAKWPHPRLRFVADDGAGMHSPDPSAVPSPGRPAPGSLPRASPQGPLVVCLMMHTNRFLREGEGARAGGLRPDPGGCCRTTSSPWSCRRAATPNRSPTGAVEGGGLVGISAIAQRRHPDQGVLQHRRVIPLAAAGSPLPCLPTTTPRR